MSNPQSPDSSSLTEATSITTGPKFVEAVKTTIVQALQKTYDSSFPDTVFQNMYVSMEYPMLETQYPGIWVRFSFSKLQIVGIASYFYNDQNHEYKMWSFEGTTTLQIFAMTSLERDRMSDSLIYMFAFGDLDVPEARFLQSIYNNPYINISLNTDQLNPGGQTENIGAPWQEDQIIYNDSYSFEMVGQFASDATTGQPVELSAIEIDPTLNTSGIRGYNPGGY